MESIGLGTVVTTSGVEYTRATARRRLPASFVGSVLCSLFSVDVADMIKSSMPFEHEKLPVLATPAAPRPRASQIWQLAIHDQYCIKSIFHKPSADIFS